MDIDVYSNSTTVRFAFFFAGALLHLIPIGWHLGWRGLLHVLGGLLMLVFAFLLGAAISSTSLPIAFSCGFVGLLVYCLQAFPRSLLAATTRAQISHLTLSVVYIVTLAISGELFVDFLSNSQELLVGMLFGAYGLALLLAGIWLVTTIIAFALFGGYQTILYVWYLVLVAFVGIFTIAYGRSQLSL